MRYAQFLFLILAVCLFGTLSTNAQTFGNAATISGTVWSTNNVPTNSITVYASSKTLTFGNITNNNQNIIVTWWVQLPTAGGGTTNYAFAAFTNNMAAYTNSGTWSTNWPYQSQTITCPVVQSVNVGTTNNTTLYEP